MGQGHRKITFKINGQEVTRNEEDREGREEGNKKSTENAHIAGEQQDTGPKPSGGGGIKESNSMGRERREVVDLSEKRKEWAERDRQPLTASPGLPLHRKKKQPEVSRSKKRGSFKHLKMPVIIIAALIVGLIFGLPLLQLATNFSLTSDAGTAGSTSGDQPSSITVDEEGAEEMQLDIVQAGAFSTNEAGHEMQEVFSEAGFPTLLHEDEEMIYLYVGMTARGEAEDEMIPEINEEGLEGYVKTLSVPIAVEGTDEETEQLASDVGEALLTGLDATGPTGNREEAERALAAIDTDLLEGDERFSETVQALHEEGNVEEHEAWMEATLAFDNWMNRY